MFLSPDFTTKGDQNMFFLDTYDVLVLLIHIGLLFVSRKTQSIKKILDYTVNTFTVLDTAIGSVLHFTL